jgi:DtxR family Mn-dependent transcriptional regulator
VSDLIDTTEMYLRTIFELLEEGIPAMRARIADRLEHSGPTVSQTVARMERDGLLELSDERLIELTPQGKALATKVMRKHRLAERLLLDIIGLEFELVHEEACRWEHVISAKVELRLLDLLGDISVSPYGNPIPGLRELGVDQVDVYGHINGLIPLSDADQTNCAVTLDRIGEPAQNDRVMLANLAAAGLLPGADAQLSWTDGSAVLVGAKGSVTVPAANLRHVYVRVD